MSNYDEDPSIHNGVLELEITIDRPIGQVWHQLLDIGSWVTSHTIEEVSEAKRTVGAITRVSFKRAKELGFPPPHYHYCKIIKLVPEQQYVLKAYSELGSSSYGVQMTGFDDTRLVAVDGNKTKVIFLAYDQIKGEWRQPPP